MKWKEPKFDLKKLYYPSGLMPVHRKDHKKLFNNIPRLIAKGPWAGSTETVETHKGVAMNVITHPSGAVMRLFC